MAPRLQLARQSFGRLTVLREAASQNDGHTRWECRCECGAAVTVLGTSLKTGNTASCGCARRERCAARLTTHGFDGHPAHRSWQHMRRRCNDPGHSDYGRYGGRGIKVCEAWNRSFEAFWADMGPTWKQGLSIDRIDSDGGYEPGNCRWATQTEQARNRRGIKLSARVAAAIRRLYADGATLRVIGLMYGLTPHYARKVAKGQIWREVPA